MAENSVILSVEEEAKLLQPIDEYVGKIQDQIDALRVDGTDRLIISAIVLQLRKKTRIYQKKNRQNLLLSINKNWKKQNQ